MMRSSVIVRSILLLAAAFVGVQAAPARASTFDELAVLEHLSKVPHGWHQEQAPPASKRLRFRIALRQQNAFAFEQHVIDISTPGHREYGQHMNHAELKRMLQPSSDASEAILGWLETQGVHSADIEDDGDWINFYVPAVEAERILDTKFYYYSNSKSEKQTIRTLHYSVPKSLHRYIHMIQPTTRFGQMKAERSTIYEHFEMGPQRGPGGYHGGGLNATFCNTTITPQCIKALYNYDNFRASAHNGNKIGVCGYLKEIAKFKDFNQFVGTFGVLIPHSSNADSGIYYRPPNMHPTLLKKTLPTFRSMAV
jgi:tripeptidyl-peptidase-1